jgi:hypothetical protein
MNAMDMITLHDPNGTNVELSGSDLDGFTALVGDTCPEALRQAGAGRIDVVSAHRAGAALYSVAVGAVDSSSGIRLVPFYSGPCDPVVAFVARLAERIGDRELAATARTRLLDDAARDVRRADGSDYARVHRWAAFLTAATGDITVTRQRATV